MSRARPCTCDDCARAPAHHIDALIAVVGLVAFIAVPGRAILHLLTGALT